MTAAPQYSIGPLITMAIDADDLRAWVGSAASGDVLVYARGAVPPRGKPVWSVAAKMLELGLIRTHQRRADDGQLEYLAVRKPSPAAITDDASPAARVFRELARCADGGEPMPTLSEIAQRCGLIDRFAAAYALRQLTRHDAGERRVQIIGHGRNHHRQALILATNKITAMEARR